MKQTNDNPGDKYEMVYNNSLKQPACPGEVLECWTVSGQKTAKST